MEFKCKFQVSGKVLEIGETQTFTSGFCKRSIIVEASKDAEKYSNPVELTLKNDEVAKADTLCVGDGIAVEGFVEGRKWDGPKGVRYFIDLNTKSIMVTEKAARPTGAKTWKELVALGAAYGENEESVKARAKALGKGFKEMTEADWQKVAGEIVAAHTPNPAGEAPSEVDDACDEEMPF